MADPVVTTSLRTGQAPIHTSRDWGQVLTEPQQQRLDVDADDVVHQLDCTVQLNLRTRFTRLMAVAVTGGTRFLPAVRDYAVQLHNIQLQRHGETTESGLTRWPVCWTDFTAPNPTMKDLDQAILGFFGRTRTRNMSTRAAAECLHEHGSRLLILAGLSGTATTWTTKPRLWLKAHLVDLTAVGPATIVLIGSDLDELFRGDDPNTRQLAGRTQLLGRVEDYPRPVRARIRRPGEALSPEDLDLRQRLIAQHDELPDIDPDGND